MTSTMATARMSSGEKPIGVSAFAVVLNVPHFSVEVHVSVNKI